MALTCQSTLRKVPWFSGVQLCRQGSSEKTPGPFPSETGGRTQSQHQRGLSGLCCGHVLQLLAGRAEALLLPASGTVGKLSLSQAPGKTWRCYEKGRAGHRWRLEHLATSVSLTDSVSSWGLSRHSQVRPNFFFLMTCCALPV